MQRRTIDVDESPQRELELQNPQRRRVALDDTDAVVMRDDEGNFVMGSNFGSVPLFDDVLWKDKLTGLSPADQAELIRFRAFLQDSTKMCPPELVRKHGDYMGFTPAEVDMLLAKNKAEDDRQFGQPHHGHGELLEPSDAFVWWAIGYTPWSGLRPPSCGYWQVKQHAARPPKADDMTANAAYFRMWYAPEIDKWYKSPTLNGGHANSKDATAIPHETLMQSHAWRGLREAPREGYPYELVQARDARCGSTLVATGSIIRDPYVGRAARRRVEL